jgi:hypothetical protein
LQLQPATLGLGQRPGEGQPNAGPHAAASPKDCRRVTPNARTLIRHLHHQASLRLAGPEGDCAGTMAQCVVKEDIDHLADGCARHPARREVSVEAHAQRAPRLGEPPAPCLVGVLRPGPVGVIFQGASLIAPLDVGENVALPLVLAGAGEEAARQRAQEALGQLGLEALCGRLPEELSGGQAQRVAVARALAGAPRLILADEPTGQLDRVTADGVIETLLAAAAASGAGLVVSTHDPLVAARLDAQWQLADGQLRIPTTVAPDRAV